MVGEEVVEELCFEVMMINEVYFVFEKQEYLDGELSLVFFGLVVNNFGVKEFLDCFVDIVFMLLLCFMEECLVCLEEDYFMGFVFKIYVNMDFCYCDWIVFMCICFGIFEWNINYLYVCQGKKMKFSNFMSFMVFKKMVVEEVYFGDVVGLYDFGNFKIGDMFMEGEELYFKGIFCFSFEQFWVVVNVDLMKIK